MLVDANVFQGFFQTHIGKPHVLCGCPATLFRAVTPASPVYHDVGRIIEHEWRGVVDRDWFEAWLATSLASGLIQYLSPTRDPSLEKRLAELGFPRSRDIVYVRIGLSVVAAHLACMFYTEDLDFYDPTQKGCAANRRRAILKAMAGPVPRLLAKSGIQVSCVP